MLPSDNLLDADAVAAELRNLLARPSTVPVDLYFFGAVPLDLGSSGQNDRPPVLLPGDYIWRRDGSDKQRVPLALCEFLAYRTALAYEREGDIWSYLATCCEGVDMATYRFFDSNRTPRFKGKTDSQGYAFVYEGKAFLIFRGTEGRQDWEFNLNDALTDSLAGEKDRRVVRLERKFGKLDALVGELKPGRHIGFALAYAVIRDQVEGWLDEQEARFGPLPIVVSGHSLGGALAVNAAYELARKRGRERIAAVVTFGAPYVGNEEFKTAYDGLIGDRTVRLESSGDIVPAIMRRWYYRGLYFLRQWAKAGLRPQKTSLFKPVGNGWLFEEEPPLSKDIEAAIRQAVRQLEEESKKIEWEAKKAEEEPAGQPTQQTESEASSPSNEKSPADSKTNGQDSSRILLWIGIGIVVLVVAGITWYFVRRKLFAHDMQQRYALYLSTLSYQQLRALHGGEVVSANAALDEHLRLTRGTGDKTAILFESLVDLPVRLKPSPDEQYLAYLKSGRAFV